MTPINSSPADEDSLPQVVQAKDDLASRLDISVDLIEVVEVQLVTWPDTSLGCPQPGMAYTQVQQDGYLIRLQVGKQLYEYHGGGTRGPFLCEKADVEHLVPPPGAGNE